MAPENRLDDRVEIDPDAMIMWLDGVDPYGAVFSTVDTVWS